MTPIGVVRSPYTERVHAPRQPAASNESATIELFAGRGFEDALSDLEGWEYIWVLFVFNRNAGWRPKVQPPRSTGKKLGVFSTRAPYRPNPIGLSVVRLERVDGLTLHVRNIDILDGSPVLDIKPYVSYTDAIPGARSGWIEDQPPIRADASDRPSSRDDDLPREGATGRVADPGRKYDVLFEGVAVEQLGWLAREHSILIDGPVTQLLSLGPQPHAYRRIRSEGSTSVLAWKEWRLRFRVEGHSIHVFEIRSGYRPREIVEGRAPAVHAAFVEKFGTPSRS